MVVFLCVDLIEALLRRLLLQAPRCFQLFELALKGVHLRAQGWVQPLLNLAPGRGAAEIKSKMYFAISVPCLSCSQSDEYTSLMKFFFSDRMTP